MKKSTEIELYPEEILLDDGGGGLIERPLSSWTFNLLMLLAIGASFLVVARLISLSVFNNSVFQATAYSNSGREIDIKAPRGILYDRFGKPLIENVPAFRAVLNLKEFYKNYLQDTDREDFFKKVALILTLDADDIKERIANHGIISRVALPGILSKEQLIALKEFNSSALDIEESYRRHYLDPEVTSEFLGYVSLLNSDDFKNGGDLKINDEVGRAGLELIYDNVLRGYDGKRVVLRDSRGAVVDKLREVSPRAGQSLKTTIDLEFQKYFYSRLEAGLTSPGRVSAVGIAINPQNGEVLSLISLPSFDNNAFGNNNEKVRKLLADKNKPLFNRAVSGLYNPGSTIKPMVALAALKEGVIDTNKSIYSAGFIELPNPYNPDTPSRFLDWKKHGWVNLYSALARSSNVYFYSVGGGFGDVAGLGIMRLKKYWQEFGLGAKTGVDLPYEGIGFLPDPEEKEKRTSQIWRIGDTYNVSIGQGDLLVTPIQLLNQIAAIANNGKFYKPHLVHEDNPVVIKDFSNLSNLTQEVKIGMRDAVIKDYGTAHLLGDLRWDVSAKTGSAQIMNNTKTNAFFVGFAPYDKPSLSIIILIEDAKEGSLNTIPIARDIFEWYYVNRIVK